MRIRRKLGRDSTLALGAVVSLLLFAWSAGELLRR
jgi:tetrahydromethanopterin S-methyltransferase subunit G